MPQKKLSTRSLLDLVDLFEQSSQSTVDADGQRLYGVPGWVLSGNSTLSDKQLEAWTDCVGYSAFFPAPCGEDRVAVEINEDDDPDRYSYRCPETFRKKYISAATVAVRSVRIPQFLNCVADLLEIPQALRRGIETAVVGNVLWNIGKMRVAETQVDVWLARNLSFSMKSVFQHLQNSALPNQGVILTTGGKLPAIIDPPRQYRVIPIMDVLVSQVSSPHLDTELIHRILVAAPGAKFEASLPVRFDPYFNTLVIATKSSKPWSIKGPKQINAVRYLFEQFRNGRRWVPAGEILADVYGTKESGRSRRMQNLFSGNMFWEDYIVNNDDGEYGFNLE
jgi:hypothetical protein